MISYYLDPYEPTSIRVLNVCRSFGYKLANDDLDLFGNLENFWGAPEMIYFDDVISP